MSFVALAALSASADEQRVYHVDAYGNVQYGKPSYKVSSDGRVVEVDAYGNKQPQKTRYAVKDGKIYEADSYGRIRHDKPSYSEFGGRSCER